MDHYIEQLGWHEDTRIRIEGMTDVKPEYRARAFEVLYCLGAGVQYAKIVQKLMSGGIGFEWNYRKKPEKRAMLSVFVRPNSTDVHLLDLAFETDNYIPNVAFDKMPDVLARAQRHLRDGLAPKDFVA